MNVIQEKKVVAVARGIQKANEYTLKPSEESISKMDVSGVAANRTRTEYDIHNENSLVC